MSERVTHALIMVESKLDEGTAMNRKREFKLCGRLRKCGNELMHREQQIVKITAFLKWWMPCGPASGQYSGWWRDSQRLWEPDWVGLCCRQRSGSSWCSSRAAGTLRKREGSSPGWPRCHACALFNATSSVAVWVCPVAFSEFVVISRFLRSGIVYSGPSVVVTGFSGNSPAVLIPPSAFTCGHTGLWNPLIFHAPSQRANG